MEKSFSRVLLGGQESSLPYAYNWEKKKMAPLTSSTPKESWTRNAYFRAAINFSKNLVDQIEIETKTADEELLRLEAESEHAMHRFEEQLVQRFRKRTIHSDDVIQTRHAYQEEEDKKRKQDLFEIREAFPLASLEDDVEYQLRIVLRNRLLSHLKRLEMENSRSNSRTTSQYSPSADNDSEGDKVPLVCPLAKIRVDEGPMDVSPTSSSLVEAFMPREPYFIPRCHAKLPLKPKRQTVHQTSSTAVPRTKHLQEGMSVKTALTEEPTSAEAGDRSSTCDFLEEPEQSLAGLHIAEFEAIAVARADKSREKLLHDRLEHFRNLIKRITVTEESTTIPRTKSSRNVKEAPRNSSASLAANDLPSVPRLEKHIDLSLKKLHKFQKERKQRAKRAQERLYQLKNAKRKRGIVPCMTVRNEGQEPSAPDSVDAEKLIREVIRKGKLVDFCDYESVGSRGSRDLASHHDILFPSLSSTPSSSPSLFSEKFSQPVALPFEVSTAQKDEVERYLWPSQLERCISHCLCGVVDPDSMSTRWNPVLLSISDVEALSVSSIELSASRCLSRNGSLRHSSTCTAEGRIADRSATTICPSPLPLAAVASYGAASRRPALPAAACMVWLHVKGRGEGVSSVVHLEGCEI